MSELCSPDNHFSSLFISDLLLLFSFIISHPLYLSYFIFFSPYLLKLISFLSPLFLTTSLLSLAFLTGLLQENFSTNDSYQKTLLVAYASALERFRAPKDYSHNEEDFQGTEDDLGLYEILFGPSLMDDREEEEEDEVEFSEEMKSEENHPLRASESARPENPGPKNITMCNKKNEAVSKVEKNVGPAGEITHPPVMQEKRLENFLKILDEFERMASDGKKKTPPPSKGAKTDKAVEKTKITVWAPEKNGSDAATTGNKISDAAASAKDGKDHSTSLTKSHSQRINSNIDNHNHNNNNNNNYDNLGTYGSMRKEKEWKRTLACKLFEERHNVDGGEGMDSLWETYETDSNKTATTKMQRKINDRKKKKKSDQIEVFEDEEEIDDPAQLCCLQALKLSAGKMNLGMGRPNLLKISKAIKGFGWLHSVTKSKKVHNSNGDRY